MVTPFLNTVLTRQEYEGLTDDLLQRTLDLCKCCLADADLKPEEIAEVLVVGGQARAPKVTEVVRKVFDTEPVLVAHLDEGVALGAAIQAGIMQGTAGDLEAIRRAVAARSRDAIRREGRAREYTETTQNGQPTWPTNAAPAVAAFWRGIRARNVETGQGLLLQIGGESYNCSLVNVYIDGEGCRVEVLTRAPVSGGEEGFLNAAKATFKVVVAGVGEESRSFAFTWTAELKGPRRWPVQVLLRLLGSDLDPDKLPRPSREKKVADTEQAPSGPEPMRLPPGRPTPQRIPHS